MVIALVVIGAGTFLLTDGDDDDQTPTQAGSSESPDEAAASPEEQPFVDALAEVIETSSNGVLSTEEARCIGQGTVDALGLPALQVTTPEEIRSAPTATLADLGVEGDQSQIDQLADATNDCVDVTQLFAATLQQQGVPTNVVLCVRNRMDTDVAATFIAAEYAGSPDVNDAANAAMEDLLSPCEDPSSG